MFKRKSRIALLACFVLSFVVIVISSAQGAGQPEVMQIHWLPKAMWIKSLPNYRHRLLQAQDRLRFRHVDNATISALQTDVGDLTKFVLDALQEIDYLKAGLMLWKMALLH